MGYSTTSNLPTAIECGVNRSHIFSRPKEKLKPFELSTVSNVSLSRTAYVFLVTHHLIKQYIGISLGNDV
jgi:hypothetical protein